VHKVAVTAILYRLANYISLNRIIHVYMRLLQLRDAQKLPAAYLTSWHNSNFDYKLRTK